MAYYIDEKVIELMTDDSIESRRLYDEYTDEILAIRVAFLESFLKDKGFNEELIDRYFESIASQLENAVNGTVESEITPELDSINKIVSSEECRTKLESLVDGMNKTYYDEARTKMSDKRKSELNDYLDEVERERKKLSVLLKNEIEKYVLNPESEPKVQGSAPSVSTETQSIEGNLTPLVQVPGESQEVQPSEPAQSEESSQTSETAAQGESADLPAESTPGATHVVTDTLGVVPEMPKTETVQPSQNGQALPPVQPIDQYPN